MKSHLLPALVTMLLGSLAQVASAQFVVTDRQTPIAVDFGDRDHASTAWEGALYGEGVRSIGLGLGNYFHSLAGLNYAEFERRSWENKTCRQQHQREQRERNDRERTAKTLVKRIKNQAQTHERYQASLPLRDAITQSGGQIPWPVVFERPQFATQRFEIGDRIEQWTTQGCQISRVDQLQVRDEIMTLHRLLREHGSDLSKADRRLAADFLNQLNLQYCSKATIAAVDFAGF